MVGKGREGEGEVEGGGRGEGYPTFPASKGIITIIFPVRFQPIINGCLPGLFLCFLLLLLCTENRTEEIFDLQRDGRPHCVMMVVIR